jgi:hypothetical protein
MSAARKLRGGLLAGLAVLAVALITPAIDHASAEPNNGGGKVTCQGGGEPGDVQTYHTWIYVNGKLVGKSQTSRICGKDGQWHEVSAISTPNSTPIVTTTTLTPPG